MGLFDKVTEPIFLKESSSSAEQLEQLNSLLSCASEEIKPQIERDIKLLEYGIKGEEQIAFELKNSHIPMYILHDLHIQDGDLSAQIDYLIITRRRSFVVECKNLYGNIEITAGGDFIRTDIFNGKLHKEGIYSPITQNQRHLELIKKIKKDAKSNVLYKAMFEKMFYDTYRSVVVLANPKTVLNAKYAKKEIRDQVIRADQLVQHIKRVNAEPGIGSEAISERDTEQLAKSFLKMHCENKTDYTEKYKQKTDDNEKQSVETVIKTQKPKTEPAEQVSDAMICPVCGSPMIKRTAKRGSNIGNEFWGCSSYPKCRGIVSNDKLRDKLQ